MIVLCDMDGVIADWEAGHNRRILELDPTFPVLHIDDRRGFYSEAQYPEHLRPTLLEAMRSPLMYSDLDPIDGAAQALDEMAGEHTVFLCSTPQDDHLTCASDKVAWIKQHLGEAWSKRLILTHDKTLVHGDILIDDKSVITGVRTPDWQHLVFDQPYNRELDAHLPRLTGWQNWKSAVEYAAEFSGRTLS